MLKRNPHSTTPLTSLAPNKPSPSSYEPPPVSPGSGSSKEDARKPMTFWPRSTAGSPRALTPPTCKRRRRCWTRSRRGAAMTFEDLFAQLCELLQRQSRVSYWALKRRFDLSDDDIEGLKDELIVAKHLARDEDGRVLVWTGRTSSAPPTASPIPSPAMPEAHPAQGETVPIAP